MQAFLNFMGFSSNSSSGIIPLVTISQALHNPSQSSRVGIVAFAYTVGFVSKAILSLIRKWMPVTSYEVNTGVLGNVSNSLVKFGRLQCQASRKWL